MADALVYRGADAALEVEHMALPVPREGEVLCTVALATICGSDLHTLQGRRAEPYPGSGDVSALFLSRQNSGARGGRCGNRQPACWISGLLFP
jgi:threonine dehydrogenase-like Zn-dependent dehydrogenase